MRWNENKNLHIEKSLRLLNILAIIAGGTLIASGVVALLATKAIKID